VEIYSISSQLIVDSLKFSQLIVDSLKFFILICNAFEKFYTLFLMFLILCCYAKQKADMFGKKNLFDFFIINLMFLRHSFFLMEI
jgi:hypothetical protein